jgi:hypothetical protein
VPQIDEALLSRKQEEIIEPDVDFRLSYTYRSQYILLILFITQQEFKRVLTHEETYNFAIHISRTMVDDLIPKGADMD